jgi:hypothetical protein
MYVCFVWCYEYTMSSFSTSTCDDWHEDLHATFTSYPMGQISHWLMILTGFGWVLGDCTTILKTITVQSPFGESVSQPTSKKRTTQLFFLSCSCMFQDYWFWLNLIPEFWIYVWVENGPCLDNLKSWQMYATCHFPPCSHSRWYPGNFGNCTGVWVSAMKQWHDGSGKSMKIADSGCGIRQLVL